jgi:hypothetical protein
LTARSFASAAVRWLGWTGLLWVLAVVGVQFWPLLDVLGYEFATLVSLLITTLGGIRAVHAARAMPHPTDLWSTWWRIQGDLVSLVTLSAVVSLLNQVRVTNCDVPSGLGYWLVLGCGGIPFVAALGLAVGLLTRGRWTWFWYFGAVMASLASSLAWIALQPAITFYNPFLGWFAGSIYDESLLGMQTHTVFRLWGGAWATAIVALLAVRLNPSGRARLLLLAAALCVTAGWVWRGELGLERSRGWVSEALGGHVQTEHFEIHYEASAFDDEDLAQLVYDHEARYEELRTYWQTEPDERLVSFVYGSQDSKGALMGGRRTLVAKIWLGEMHITWDGPGDELLGHEMAHLFLRADGTGPLRLATVGGLIPLMALVEGSATAAAWGTDELDDHAWSAAMRRLDLAEDISELLGPFGFWARPSGRAYTLTGSFCRWLIAEHGPAAFRQMYAHGDFETAYGRPLSALVADWHTYLDAIPLTDAMLEVARFRFDRPSIFGKQCARSIGDRFAEANRFLQQRAWEDAHRCYERILSWDPTNLGNRLQIAERYASAGRLERARELAQTIVDEPGAGRTQRIRAGEMIADLRWMQEGGRAAADAYAALLNEAALPSDRRRLWARAWGAAHEQTAPLTSAAVRRALVPWEETPPEAAVAELISAWHAERQPLAAYLAALRLTSSDSSLVTELFDAALSATPEQLGDADAAAFAEQSLRIRSSWSWRNGRFDASCADWLTLSQRATVGSSNAQDAAFWLDRCARLGRPLLDLPAEPVE